MGGVGVSLQHLEQALLSTVARPAHEAVIAALPGAIARRNIAPWRSRFQSPRDAVDGKAVINVGMAAMGMRGSVRCQQAPLLFEEVGSAYGRRTEQLGFSSVRQTLTPWFNWFFYGLDFSRGGNAHK